MKARYPSSPTLFSALCELIVGGKEGLTAGAENHHRPLCAAGVSDYLNDPRPENMPVLEDPYNLFRSQEEKEAQYIATAP